MKTGRLSNQELNRTIELARKALLAMPERSVAFAIAPHLASERRSGLRSEIRMLGVKGIK